MQLLAPAALAALFLALPIGLAFIHRHRVRHLRVSSVEIFRVIASPKPVRTRARRVEHLLALLLTLAALVLGALGLSDPVVGQVQPRNLVVVFDASASMAGLDEQSVPLRDRALKALQRAIDELAVDDRVALIVAGTQVESTLGLTTQHTLIVEAAERVQASGQSSSVGPALRLADSLCESDEVDSLLLLSDGSGVALPKTACALAVPNIGSLGVNAGIVGFSARRVGALGLAELHLSVSNHADVPRAIPVQIALDGRVVDVRAVEVPAGGVVSTLFTMALPDGEELVASLALDGPDSLASDDRALARVGGQRRARVLLISDDPKGFVARALALHPRVDASVVPSSYARGVREAFDLLVIEHGAGAVLPPAPRVLALGVPPEPLGLAVERRVANPRITRWAFDDPWFRFVDLDEVHALEAVVLRPPEGSEVLIEVAEGPIALRTEWDGRELVYLGFEPTHSDLVLRIGFVHLIANAIDVAGAPIDADPVQSQANPLTSVESLGAVGWEPRQAPAVQQATLHLLPWWWVVVGLLILLLIETSLPWWAVVSAAWSRRGA